MNKKTIKIFSSIEKLAIHSADFLIKRINQDLSGKQYSIALSGGSTPKKIYQYLADNYSDKIDWQKIKIFFGDERCVPSNDVDSNYKMAYETLFTKISIIDENIFKINGETPPIEEAARYGKIIKANLPKINDIPQFDVILLGLGGDGHTTSIFPEQIEKFYSPNICEVASHPITGQKRITITGEIINNAKLIVFIVTGEEKSKIISEILVNDNEKKTFPASLVKPKNGELIWMMDSDAAQLLDSQIKETCIIL